MFVELQTARLKSCSYVGFSAHLVSELVTEKVTCAHTPYGAFDLTAYMDGATWVMS